MTRKNDIAEVIEAIQKSMKAPLPEAIAKAWVQPGSPTSGLAAYDLEAPAKLLYPVLTPLRNSIPREGGGVGTAVNWRAITGINTTDIEAGVSEGNRGGVISHSTQDKTAAYRGIGLEDNVTFEADYASQTFDDVKARAVQGTLWSTMIQEEKIILGGNTSLALGTTPTPTTSTSTTGGSIAAATYNVICVALTLNGFLTASVSAAGVRGTVTRTNADGTADTYGGGSARQSAAASQATTGSTSTISASVAVVPGAVAYAWYVGTAGAEKIVAITKINSVLITALPAAGNQLASAIPGAAADNSTNLLIFDGLLTQIWTPGSGSYIKNMATGTPGTGTPLTADTKGGIVEFDEALQSFWDNYKLSPDEILVGSGVQNDIRLKILTGGSAAAQRFVFDMQQNAVRGGTMAISYLNPFGMPAGSDYAQGSEIPIVVHPNLPDGTVIFRSKRLPYKLSNVTDVLKMKLRRDYYQLEWPLRTRKYEYGVYMDGLLQNYFPPAFGVITNIARG